MLPRRLHRLHRQLHIRRRWSLDPLHRWSAGPRRECRRYAQVPLFKRRRAQRAILAEASLPFYVQRQLVGLGQAASAPPTFAVSSANTGVTHQQAAAEGPQADAPNVYPPVAVGEGPGESSSCRCRGRCSSGWHTADPRVWIQIGIDVLTRQIGDGCSVQWYVPAPRSVLPWLTARRRKVKS